MICLLVDLSINRLVPLLVITILNASLIAVLISQLLQLLAKLSSSSPSDFSRFLNPTAECILQQLVGVLSSFSRNSSTGVSLHRLNSDNSDNYDNNEGVNGSTNDKGSGGPAADSVEANVDLLARVAVILCSTHVFHSKFLNSKK